MEGFGRLVAPALLAVFLLSPAPAAERAALLSAAATITKSELQKHVEVLADDSMEGREGGSRGGQAAGGYLVAEFEKLGLKPLGDGKTFYQSFPGNQRNILGLWEGSDDKLKQQYIILGAHYDHVGYGSRTTSLGPIGHIHNGADDNASGVAALLEVIQAFAALDAHPKRSVVFALWDGEEKGLLGSKHWLGRPTVPLKNVVLYVNLDMVGRMRRSKLEVYGTRSSYGLRELASRHNEDNKLWLDFTWEMKDNSDHWPFFERNIPAMMFHTGLHENYHRPSDDAYLLNGDGMEQISRLLFTFTHDIADSDRALKFRPEARREDPAGRRSFEQPLAAPAPRLGLEWKEPPAGESGVVASRITVGSPADKAGVRGGDRIVKFGGEDVTPELDLRMAVLAAKSPVEMEVMRAGGEEPVKLTVNLNGSPTRLGISWKDDPAEPGTVLLTQVVYGSAAQKAGLKERDRIYEIGGERFANSAEFREKATTLGSPLEVLIERAGTLHRLKLEPRY